MVIAVFSPRLDNVITVGAKMAVVNKVASKIKTDDFIDYSQTKREDNLKSIIFLLKKF